tara:strand:+ start:74 stop:811 length:738 start_codon:yes stop_codon:yes gene_type:complete
MTKKTILITGSSSRFCRFLKKDFKNHKTYFTQKKKFNILNLNQMIKFVKDKKITHLVHIAGLSRPMFIHDKNISKSIDLNIIGTANIVKLCEKFKIKLIYFSTNYVYPGKKGRYKEDDPLLPVNNYAWSKLGGESSVRMYENSLILRIAMTDYPFTHSKAIKGAYSSFIYNKTVSKILPYLIKEKGILNIGGKRRDIFNFAKKFVSVKIKSVNFNKVKNFPRDSSLNISKLMKILKKFKLKEITI